MQSLDSTATNVGNYYGSPAADIPLPFEAAEKLRALRQQAADANAVARAATLPCMGPQPEGRRGPGRTG